MSSPKIRSSSSRIRMSSMKIRMSSPKIKMQPPLLRTSLSNLSPTILLKPRLMNIDKREVQIIIDLDS